MGASSSAALNKGTLLIAVCAVLLHSSSGQQPAAAPLDCSNCAINCTQRCQALADAQASFCNQTLGPGGVYDSCFQSVASRACNSNSYAARGSCIIGTCTANLCGSPSVRSACDSCTSIAQTIFSRCMFIVSQIQQFCMPDCTSRALPRLRILRQWLTISSVYMPL